MNHFNHVLSLQPDVEGTGVGVHHLQETVKIIASLFEALNLAAVLRVVWFLDDGLRIEPQIREDVLNVVNRRPDVQERALLGELQSRVSRLWAELAVQPLKLTLHQVGMGRRYLFDGLLRETEIEETASKLEEAALQVRAAETKTSVASEMVLRASLLRSRLSVTAQMKTWVSSNILTSTAFEPGQDFVRQRGVEIRRDANLALQYAEAYRMLYRLNGCQPRDLLAATRDDDVLA